MGQAVDGDVTSVVPGDEEATSLSDGGNLRASPSRSTPITTTS
ncbi:hypothetical protein [Halobaculum sp. MBLA0143]